MSQYMPPKLTDMTAADLVPLTRTIGLPGLPYPMTRLAKVDGKLDWQLGLSDPLVVYSPHLSLEQVNREMYANMPTPSMMALARKLVAITRPNSKNRLMAIFGDPSCGKTFLFRQVGALVHPEGTMMMDCGGMNAQEFFWRTVIDYGAGVQEQLNQRAANGTLSAETVALLREQFPASLTEKQGRYAINWSAIGARRDNNETQEAAIARAQKILLHVYNVYERINTQSNAFGVKAVPGELIRSFRSGRPILLDEFTKSKIGSDAAMMTFLEFVRGDRDEWTTVNTGQTTAADDEKTITLRASDIRLGWHIGISGNEAKDGYATHDVSDSIRSRLSPHYVGAMTAADWEHRIPQLLAGFPAKTFHRLFTQAAADNPEKFAQVMEGLSTLGMTAAQQKLRPPHHRYLLRNFPDLIAATDKLAAIYATRHALSNTDCALYQEPRWRNCAGEVMAGGAAKLQVTSRRLLDDLHEALEPRPQVADTGASTLDFDLNRVFNAFSPQQAMAAPPAWHELGAALSQVIIEGIFNDTGGMPLVRAALLAECEDQGIVAPMLNEASRSKEGKLLSDLLRYDPIKDMGMGDSAQARKVAQSLLVMIKGMYPGVVLTQDQLSLENIALALQGVTAEMKKSDYAIGLPNTDLDSLIGRPWRTGYSVPVYALDDIEGLAGGDAALVPLEAVLAALAADGADAQNFDRLWPHDMNVSGMDEANETFRESMAILRGASGKGFDFAATQVAGNAGAVTSLYLLRDRVRGKIMAMADAEIGQALKAALLASGISYHPLGQEATFDTVDTFVFEGDVARASPAGEREKQTIQLMTAFMTMHGIKDAHMAKGATFGRAMKDNLRAPVLYSRIVMPLRP